MKMKKLLITALTLVAIAGFAGCSGKTDNKTTDDTKVSEEGTSGESRLAKIKASGKLVIGTSPDFAPMEFQDVTKTGDEQYVGADMELARYIAEKLGVELEIKAMEFSAIEQAVDSGTIDCGISGFGSTPERAENYELSILYDVTDDGGGHTLLVKKGEGAKYTSADDFAGKKVLAQNASLQQSLVMEQLPSDIVFQPISAITDGVLMLINNKADALAVSYSNGELLVNSYPEEIEMVDWKFDYDEDGNTILMKKGETELAEAINEILKEVNESGIFNEWTEDAKELAKSLGIE